MIKLTWFYALWILLLTAGCSSATVTPVVPTVALPTTIPSPQSTPTRAITVTQTPLPTPTSIDPLLHAYAFQQNRRLGRGVNLGNALEAPKEGEWGMTLQEEYFKIIKEAGFSSVRVPINWSAHAERQAPYTIGPAFFERVDWVLKQTQANNLVAILDLHNYPEIMDTPGDNKERFLSLWQQIAEHYKDYPDSVYFELLNEPNSTLGATSWNQFAKEAIQVIRETNPNRTIVVGPGDWNSITGLFNLSLPDDPNLIVTFHYYLPFKFTHQGADWVQGSESWLGTTWQGTEDEKQAVRQDLDLALGWAKMNKRPIFMGEFGAYSKADMDSRARWTDFVAREAEKRSMSWAYWEFGAGFGVYDRVKNGWNRPILRALIPQE